MYIHMGAISYEIGRIDMNDVGGVRVCACVCSVCYEVFVQ